MSRQSERLEREAGEARGELAASLAELRLRMTPGEIVDEVIDYARETPMADFMRNLARDVRENPAPLLVIFAGIAWAVISSSLSRRRSAAREEVATRTAAVEACPIETVPALERQDWEVAPLDEAIE